MFNPLTRIRHRCPFCGTTQFIFEWEGRYMYYCAVHLNGPYADTREEAWISGAERLEHERRKAWSEGYAAGWKDHECDFPPYTSENPYKETNKIGKEGK